MALDKEDPTSHSNRQPLAWHGIVFLGVLTLGITGVVFFFNYLLIGRLFWSDEPWLLQMPTLVMLIPFDALVGLLWFGFLRNLRWKIYGMPSREGWVGEAFILEQGEQVRLRFLRRSALAAAFVILCVGFLATAIWQVIMASVLVWFTSLEAFVFSVVLIPIVLAAFVYRSQCRYNGTEAGILTLDHAKKRIWLPQKLHVWRSFWGKQERQEVDVTQVLSIKLPYPDDAHGQWVPNLYVLSEKGKPTMLPIWAWAREEDAKELVKFLKKELGFV